MISKRNFSGISANSALVPKLGTCQLVRVRIIKRATLRDFWEANRDAEQALKSWFQEAKRADWESPQDVKAMYGNASAIGGNRVVFRIAGNKYRLVVDFNYPY